MALKAASPALMCGVVSVDLGLDGDGNRKVPDVADQKVAFVLAHIQPGGGESGQAGVGGLVPAGDLKPKLTGSGGEDEFFECCRLCLPAETADASIFEAAHAPLELRRAGRLSPGGCLDRLVGNGVEPARTEQRRRISF